MHLHLMDFLHHHAARNDSPAGPPAHNVLYTALLVIGVPVTVAATMFAVRYLYDGVMWLLPS